MSFVGVPFTLASAAHRRLTHDNVISFFGCVLGAAVDEGSDWLAGAADLLGVRWLATRTSLYTAAVRLRLRWLMSLGAVVMAATQLRGAALLVTPAAWQMSLVW